MRPVLILAAFAALSACGNEKTTTVTTEDGKEVKITANGGNSAESGTITFEGKDGSGKIVYGEDAAKAGLPLGLPVYPGGEVQGAFSGGDKDSKGGMVTVITSDPPAKVIEFYKAEASKRGFGIEGSATAAAGGSNMTSFSAMGKGGETLMVTASPGEGGKTQAMIIAGSKN
jgi:hypothetical protein